MANWKAFVEENWELMLRTLKELCAIPAPSHQEHKRAEYCKRWLENVGAKGVYIDEALNVILPLNCQGSNEISVIAAHTDTVFPDLEPLPYEDRGDTIHCPGIGDDTIAVVMILLSAKYLIANNIQPEKGLLMVCNSCEEGLGDLKGTRQLFKDYAGRISRFVSFDGDLHTMHTESIGSHRYQVTVRTPGGHSLYKFGSPNALNELAQMITKIYAISVPREEGSTTTYNVGTVNGGTSVNTIAQEATMLCEYRSNKHRCLETMKGCFEEIFRLGETESVRVEVKQVGDRPCGKDIDPTRQQKLTQLCRCVSEEVLGVPIRENAASTDCNIPHSLGIPAVAMGICSWHGIHTREEWIDKKSLIPGLEIALRVILSLTEKEERV